MTAEAIDPKAVRLIDAMSELNYTLALFAHQMWEARFFKSHESPWGYEETRGMTTAEAEQHPEFCVVSSMSPTTAIIGAARLREPALVSELEA